MLRGLYTANVDREKSGLTPLEAEDKYRLQMAALVESEQRPAENVPIILPGGVAKNNEIKKRQERERAEFMRLVYRLNQLDAQIAALTAQIATLDAELLQLAIDKAVRDQSLVDIANAIDMIEDGLTDEERTLLVERYGDIIVNMDEDEIIEFLEARQREDTKALEDIERRRLEAEREREEHKARLMMLEQEQEDILSNNPGIRELIKNSDLTEALDSSYDEITVRVSLSI